MATQMIMPQMSYDMREGKIVRWLKSEGEEVKRGEPIAEIETDKAVVKIDAFASGLLRKIVINEGQSAPVGDIIAYIGAADEKIPKAPTKNKEQEDSTTIETAQKLEDPTPEESTPAHLGEIKASPLARRIAEGKGIDLSQVTGTGPGGRITKEDLLAYEASGMKPTATAAASSDRIDLPRMRQAIARVTVQSKTEAPHFYVTTAIDMTKAMEMRKEINAALEEGVRVTVNDIVVKACAKTLLKHPKFNSTYKGDHLEVHPSVNVSIAIALEEGLILPAIPHCDKKSLVEVARDSKDIAKRAAEGNLLQEEYSGGTFGVSNLGMFDVDEFVAIIYPPQAAMLAVGSVRAQPVVRSDEVVIRQILKATISVDHRVADGAEAARFLSDLKRLLESPTTILL
jgi:pyruvate dehydrogenase E2 component (dihydrolipoamide acetyltransferase)